MPVLNLDFSRIRPLAGSQQTGFEELTAQLASLEPRPAGSLFFRKGPGADAGVECYVRHPAGDETGWQAKYFDKLEASQIGQLDKSIEQALKKHPRLERYIVCLPINLRDARSGKSQTELQRWQAWVTKWTSKKRKSKVQIELWGRSELLERLGRDDPLYSGRASFWFDEIFLTKRWFSDRFAASKDSLGERYTPETNVELPIRRALLGFCRDPSMLTEIERWWQGVEEKGHDAVKAVERLDRPKLRHVLRPLVEALSLLSRTLTGIPTDAAFEMPIEPLKSAANEALACLARVHRARWELKIEEEERERFQYAGFGLRRLEETLDSILSALHSDRWSVVNSRRLLVKGAAGVGKSHLFADAVDHLIQNDRPALLILSGTLIEDDPWAQIIRQLGLDLTPQKFLGALDAAAQAAGTRAVIFLDAINEHHGIALWAQRLPAFLSSIERFPRVGLALSCRTTYLPYVLPHSVEKRLNQIEHMGFAGRAAEAARYYLDRRGIARMSAPNLVPEFENPLFLKTCCDYLDKEGLKEIPRGLRGVTQIFDFYGEAVARAVETRLALDRNLRIVLRALEAFASALEDNDRGYLDYDTAAAVLDPFLPAQGSFQRSLLAQLVSEGILSTEPVAGDDGSVRQYVRFTFERYSDHRLAKRLLDEHLDTADPVQSFVPGTVLHTYLGERGAYEYAGVIEALAIQLPERCGLELPDALSAGHRNRFIINAAFVDSALWRAQKSFTPRTLELLKEASRTTGQDEATRVLLAVATEPDNEFNARYLHDRLIRKTMSERDQHWSIYVATEGDAEDSPIETLLTWTAQNGFGSIEKERAELAAIALTWLLSTSHRGIRDRATKALATLLAPRLDLAATLLHLFKNVDDLYVLDRLLAAAYGGALQGVTTRELPELAHAAFTLVFDRDPPIVHVLIRDYARGIIELAHARKALPRNVTLKRARPPYRSPPVDEVPESLIETYQQDYPGGHRFHDDIVSSTVNDGDFARYIVDHAVDDFSVLPIAWAGRSEEDIYDAWEQTLVRDSPEAAEKLIALHKLAQAWREKQGPFGLECVKIEIEIVEPGKKERDRRTAVERRFDKAEDDLRATLSEDGWRSYCAEARAYVRRDLRGAGRIYPWPPQFDPRQGRRWICKRAHDLGWTQERFAEFDRNISHDRHEHRLERVGKKYQWIAFHELLARLGDNHAFIGWSRREGTRIFQGPWEISCRDIDPSLLCARSRDDDWRKEDRTWWLPVRVNLKPLSPHSRVAWLDSPDDVVNGESMIAVTEPGRERQWLVLEVYADWNQWAVREGDRKLDRTVFVHVRSLLTRATDRDALVKSFAGRSLLGTHNLPEIERPSDSFIGEYPWHPLFASMPIWIAPSSRDEIAVETQPTIAEYLAERGGHDYSIEETFRYNVPGPGIFAGMGLHLSNGRELSYASRHEEVLFFDPSIRHAGPSAALVDRAAFLAFLTRKKLAAVWIITGEKNVYGGVGYHPEGFGGSRSFTSIYWLEKDGFAATHFEDRDDPTPDQLAKLYAEIQPGSGRGAVRRKSVPKPKPKVTKRRAKPSQNL